MTDFLTITWNPDPDLIAIGPIHIRYYGALFVAGFVAAYYVMLYVFKREKVPVALLDKLTINIAVATLIGARLGHCLFYQPDYFLAHPLEIILPVQFEPHFRFIGYQGLASHGAAIGILIGIWYWCRQTKKPYLWLLDRIGIVVALAGMFVRLGNLMNSEIYGDVTTLPWGFIFVHAGESLPHHPTQLYEALSYLLIFFLLFALYKKKTTTLPRGFLFGLFLILLFSARFFIEFIKEPQVGFEVGMTLNMGQLLSLPFVLAGAALLVWSLVQGKKVQGEKVKGKR